MPPPPRLPPAHQGKTQAVPGTVRLFWESGHAAAVHHRPTGSAVNTGLEALQPSREDAMLEITRISLPKDAPAAKGRYARGTGRHWPEPQCLGTEPDGGLLGRLSGTPRAADSPLPPPPKKKKTGTALDKPSPLPSVQPQGVPDIAAPPVQPRIPARRRSSRQGKMPCLGLPAFPCRKTLLPPRGDAPVERGGIGLNLSALERNQTADCSAGCPARPERRTALFRPQKRKPGTALDGPSPLPSVQPQGVPGITAPPVQPQIPARRHPSRQERMPCLGLPAFPCRKTPLPPRGDAPVERRRHWPEPQRLGTEPDGGLLGRLPGTPRAAALFRPPKKKTGTALDGPVPVAVCTATGRSRHHRPTGSAVNTVSEALLPPREDAMLEITRISLPKDAPAAKGRCACGTGRHWPEPQRLGTEPDGGLLGRLPGTP